MTEPLNLSAEEERTNALRIKSEFWHGKKGVFWVAWHPCGWVADGVGRDVDDARAQMRRAVAEALGELGREPGGHVHIVKEVTE